MSDNNIDSIFHRWENDTEVIYSATVCHRNLHIIRHLPGVLKVGRYGAVMYSLGNKVVLDHGDQIIRCGTDTFKPIRLGKFESNKYRHYDDKCPTCLSGIMESVS